MFFPTIKPPLSFNVEAIHFQTQLETQDNLLDNDSIIDRERIAREAENVPGSNFDRIPHYECQLEVLRTHNVAAGHLIHPFRDLLLSERHSEGAQVCDHSCCD